MHIHKTGALIRAAVLLGAHAGGRWVPTSHERLDHFAKRVGLLFQVVDDILDAEASTATLGKTAGKDAADKPTYVSLLGLVDARALPTNARDARASLTPSASARCACTSWPTSSCTGNSEFRP
jgi:farnesyl diphosphate synthase